MQRSKLASVSALCSKTGTGQPCARACTVSASQYAPFTSRTENGRPVPRAPRDQVGQVAGLSRR